MLWIHAFNFAVFSTSRWCVREGTTPVLKRGAFEQHMNCGSAAHVFSLNLDWIGRILRAFSVTCPLLPRFRMPSDDLWVFRHTLLWTLFLCWLLERLKRKLRERAVIYLSKTLQVICFTHRDDFIPFLASYASLCLFSFLLKNREWFQGALAKTKKQRLLVSSGSALMGENVDAWLSARLLLLYQSVGRGIESWSNREAEIELTTRVT